MDENNSFNIEWIRKVQRILPKFIAQCVRSSFDFWTQRITIFMLSNKYENTTAPNDWLPVFSDDIKSRTMLFTGILKQPRLILFKQALITIGPGSCLRGEKVLTYFWISENVVRCLISHQVNIWRFQIKYSSKQEKSFLPANIMFNWMSPLLPGCRGRLIVYSSEWEISSSILGSACNIRFCTNTLGKAIKSCSFASTTV